MENKRTFLKSNIFICIILVVFGLILEYFVTDINTSLFRYPLNIICLLLFIVFILSCHVGYGKTKLLNRLKSRDMALAIIMIFVYILILLGIIPQDRFLQTVEDNTIIRDLGFFTITKSYPFLFIYLFLLFALGLTIVSQIKRTSVKGILLSTSHIGLWIVLAAGFFGAPDFQEYRINAVKGQESTMATNKDSKLFPLPFSIQLNEFVVEYYENNTPKYFSSKVSVIVADSVIIQETIEVNEPLKFGYYYIYQSGYDTTPQSKEMVSMFKIVYDPWLRLIYIGIAMLLLSAMMMIFIKNKI